MIFFLLGCGVKSDPVPPEGSALPSIPDMYLKKPIIKKSGVDKEDEKQPEKKNKRR